MSKEVTVQYRIERERQQELFEARVRETTEKFLARHEALLDDLAAQGIEIGVAEEVRRARADLAQARRLLHPNPVAARGLSIDIGDRLRGLPARARATFRAAREADMQARVQAQQAALQGLEARWRERLASWDDPFLRELAAPALARLHSELLRRGQSATLDELDAGLVRVRAEVETRAQAVRQEAAREAEAAAAKELQDELRARGGDAPLQGLAHAVEREDEAAVAEAVRREAVLAVHQALEDAGFVIDKPRRVREGGLDEVVLRAARPSGAEAVFRIDLGGAMHYEFDRYEGTACRADIERVVPALESVYGIRLSDERVLWENPDDQHQDARPRPGNDRSESRE